MQSEHDMHRTGEDEISQEDIVSEFQTPSLSLSLLTLTSSPEESVRPKESRPCSRCDEESGGRKMRPLLKESATLRQRSPSQPHVQIKDSREEKDIE